MGTAAGGRGAGRRPGGVAPPRAAPGPPLPARDGGSAAPHRFLSFTSCTAVP